MDTVGITILPALDRPVGLSLSALFMRAVNQNLNSPEFHLREPLRQGSGEK
jgi:hypothetical protein